MIETPERLSGANIYSTLSFLSIHEIHHWRWNRFHWGQTAPVVKDWPEGQKQQRGRKDKREKRVKLEEKTEEWPTLECLSRWPRWNLFSGLGCPRVTVTGTTGHFLWRRVSIRCGPPGSSSLSCVSVALHLGSEVVNVLSLKVIVSSAHDSQCNLRYSKWGNACLWRSDT